MLENLAELFTEPYYATITVDAFFNEFFPELSAIEQCNHYGNFESVAKELYNEKTYYKPICKAVNQMLRKVGLSEYVLMFTGKLGEDGTKDRLKPDLSLYRKTSAAQAAFMDPGEAQADLETSLSKENYKARAAWAWMVSVIEMKPTTEYEALSRMVSYATEIQNRQHREFVLMAFIHQAHIRFMRWDRAGTIVSHPVGYDPTAELADDADINRLKSLYKKLSRKGGEAEDKDRWLHHHLRAIISNRRFHPIYRIFCEDTPGCKKPETANRRKIYLIGKPLNFKGSPIGRASRGYVTLDVDRDSLVFMKDTWRPYVEDTRSETDIYVDLNAKRVRFIATVLAGGDVGGPTCQRTKSQNYFKVKPEDKPTERIHHRFIQKEVGRALETYATQRELLLTLNHAFTSHRDAWEKAGILHRNVSASNILIDVRTGRGLLNDWTMCQYKSEMSKDATWYGRYGSWTYMSAALLRFPMKPNQLFDDLESFLHVATIMGLRFHLHDRSAKTRDKENQVVIDETEAKENEQLAEHLKTKYSKSIPIQDGFYIGGEIKFNDLIRGKSNVVFDMPERPLFKFINDLRQLFQPFYQSLDEEAYKRLYYPKLLKDEENDVPLIVVDNDDFKFEEEELGPLSEPLPQKSPSHQYSLEDMTHKHFARVWQSMRQPLAWPDNDKTVDQFEGRGGEKC
ncbi:hypothetical protein EVG20_g7370 [Dentipellis fragilis]|uniref:Fungal-type protein kinase domain-containing protein n=1 Tax=Dentipellis fragilis TaxID=205917 RepID=A0A4Y9YEE7_9AGAM|nr:hypothetical protein EVG20_g7370 [Dentipellis fragilis]